MNVVLNQAVMGQVEQLDTVKRFQQPLPTAFWRPIIRTMEAQIRPILKENSPETLASMFPSMTAAKKWKFRMWKTKEVNRLRRATSCLEVLGMCPPPSWSSNHLTLPATTRRTVTTFINLKWNSTAPNNRLNTLDLNDNIFAFRNGSNPPFRPHQWTNSGMSKEQARFAASLPDLAGSRSGICLPTEVKLPSQLCATQRRPWLNKDQSWVYMIAFCWRKEHIAKRQDQPAPRLPLAVLNRLFPDRKTDQR